MSEKRNSILIVEDEQAGRKLLRKCLQEYTVYEAADGIEGWELFVRHTPDVVITDLAMPNRNGLTMFKMIKDQSPLTPVIIFSGAGEKTDIIEALRLGAADYLEKPILSQEIVSHTVQKALNLLRLEELSQKYQQTLEKEVAEKTVQLREELKRRTEGESKILRAQREWQRTFDAMPDLIAIIDKDHRIIRTNRAMAQAMAADTLSIKGCYCFSMLHGTTEPPPYCPQKKLLDDQKKHSIEIYEEQLGGHFEITVVPYYNGDGDLLGSVHIARNINDRKANEAEKEKMQVQLLHAQKLESVGQLAAGIAHEINTPIQFVSTNNDFLDESYSFVSKLIHSYETLFQAAKEGKVDSDLLGDVERSRQEADWEYLADEIPKALEQNKGGLQRVASIVRAMKEFSHPGAKEKEMSSLNDILNTTAIVARNEWKYVAELDLILDQALPAVMCYADDMGQVFLNIIINAAHAIEDKLGRNPEGVKGRIEVRSGKAGEFAEVVISDTGVGIAEAKLKKIFDPFFTTKQVGRGTGQGLAIAWNIVTDKHKGRMAVESKEGEGATFIIRIPLSTDQ